MLDVRLAEVLDGDRARLEASPMHAFRAFVQEQMDVRGWTGADLARASGLSRQHVSKLLSDDRAKVDRMPDAETISGLARAFSVDELLVLTKIGQAMGIPVAEPVIVYDASRVPNEDLIRVLAERLGTKEVVGNAPHPAPIVTSPDAPAAPSAEPAAPAAAPEHAQGGGSAGTPPAPLGIETSPAPHISDVTPRSRKQTKGTRPRTRRPHGTS